LQSVSLCQSVYLSSSLLSVPALSLYQPSPLCLSTYVFKSFKQTETNKPSFLGVYVEAMFFVSVELSR
ncbi:MAG: hypothetical protein ACK56I_26510, partial [bacterium]